MSSLGPEAPDALPGKSALARAAIWVRRILPLILLVGVVFLVVREMGTLDIHRLRSQVRSLSGLELATLVATGMVSVASMFLYDLLAARWLRLRIPLGRLLRYSWIANTFNNLVGMSGLTGSGIRYLLLTREGATGTQAASWSGMMVLAVPLGLSALIAATIPMAPALIDRMPAAGGWALTVVALFALYLPAFLVFTGSGVLHRRLLKSLPPLGFCYRAGLVGVSLLDWVLAVFTLWLCLRATGVTVPLDLFIAAFVLSAALGIASMLPGGLGVFDGVLLLMLSAQAPHADTLAGLLLFRLVYYLIPWLLAVYFGAGLLTVQSQTLGVRLAQRLERYPLFGILRLPVRWLASLGVRVLAWLTFAAGLILLLSVASPSLAERAALLNRYLPWSAIEGSTLLSAAIGVLLVGLSRGIASQVRAAYRLTQVLLVSGAVFSLIKGIDYEESAFLIVVALLLRGRHATFYRESHDLFSRRNLYWLTALAVAMGLFALVGGLLSTDSHLAHVFLRMGYTRLHESRFLHSLLVMALTVMGYLGWTWFRMPAPELHLPTAQELDEAKTFFEKCGGNMFSHLLFTGDKYLYYGADRRVLIQFGAIRNLFVVLGDPAGPDELIDRAVHEFREFADRHERVPVFYEVSEQRLHHYHDCGFALFKLGEQALVPLPAFTISGKRRDDLRSAINRAERHGMTFEILDHPLTDEQWDKLQRVSDAWLADKQGAEKGFSLGSFDRAYLSRAPLAVVRSGNDIIAFANLVPAYGSKRELSVDLMRHLPTAPPGTMDFLFVRLMQYGREQGYEYFNMGIAPLSGVGETPYSRRGERLAGLAYKYGGRLYNYSGLRRYKQKFDPLWQSAYLAYPYGRSPQALLLEIAALVAGGYLRVLLKNGTT